MMSGKRVLTHDVITTSFFLPNVLKGLFAWCYFEVRKKDKNYVLKTCIKSEGQNKHWKINKSVGDGIIILAQHIDRDLCSL